PRHHGSDDVDPALDRGRPAGHGVREGGRSGAGGSRRARAQRGRGARNERRAGGAHGGQRRPADGRAPARELPALGRAGAGAERKRLTRERRQREGGGGGGGRGWAGRAMRRGAGTTDTVTPNIPPGWKSWPLARRRSRQRCCPAAARFTSTPSATSTAPIQTERPVECVAKVGT